MFLCKTYVWSAVRPSERSGSKQLMEHNRPREIREELDDAPTQKKLQPNIG